MSQTHNLQEKALLISNLLHTACMICAHSVNIDHPILSLEIMCEALVSPENGKVVTTGNGVGDVATYSCDGDFMLKGSETRTCENTGMWSEEMPMCEGNFGCFFLNFF